MTVLVKPFDGKLERKLIKKITTSLLALVLATTAISSVSEASSSISSSELERLQNEYGLGEPPPVDRSSLFTGDFGLSLGELSLSGSFSFSDSTLSLKNSSVAGQLLGKWIFQAAYPIWFAAWLTLFLSTDHVE